MTTDRIPLRHIRLERTVRNAKELMLVRVTPAGETKTQGPFRRVIDAAKTAYRSLLDNGAATPASADRLVTALVAAEVGETVAHESGYRFRVEWIAKDRP